MYEFLDEKNTVLYVGKAVDLKSRVSSYFSDTVTGEKTILLVSKIDRIRITVVESELEALLLEAYYIKKYNPRYNIRLTDGKAYVLVRITKKESYPKVMLSRRMVSKDDVYYGPFPNTTAVRLVLKTVRRVFPYQSVNYHPKRICLYYHLGLCPCPPVFDSREYRTNYRKNISGIIRVFRGETKKIIREFEKKRDTLSRNEQFEEAAVMQKQINALSYITQPFRPPADYAVNPNLRSDIRQEEMLSLQRTLNENGCTVVSLRRIECYDISNIQGKNATGSMVVFREGEKESSQYRKFRIRRDATPDDFASMQEVLRRRLGHPEWEIPGLIVVDGGKGQVSAALQVLREKNADIPLIGLAKREETIVIPLSVFSHQPSAPTEFGSANSNSGISTSETDKPKTDKPGAEHRQLKTDDLSLQFKEVSLPKDSKALHLIQRIRDEAHRFAITYHRKLRSKVSMQ